jgi:hypothetical protein
VRILGAYLHLNKNPWSGAPPWAVELGLIGLRILETLETHEMATNEQVTKLMTSVEALLAALAAKAPTPAPAVPVADPAVDALDEKVVAATAALTAPPAA